jgi:hypothetical protein
MPIWKAVQLAAEVVQDHDDNKCYPEARRQLRQAALEGRIDVWGQKEIPPRHLNDEGHSVVWSKIEPSYWHDYDLSPLSTGELYEDRDHTWKEGDIVSKGNRYWNLKVRKKDIESLFWGRLPKPKPEAEPQPDFPLNGLLIRVYRHFGYPRANPSEDEQRRQINLQIMDKVVQNGLNVWGRRGDLALEKIGPAALRKARLDHRERELRAPSIDSRDMVFKDLHFSRAEVDAVWPDPLRTTNDRKP